MSKDISNSRSSISSHKWYKSCFPNFSSPVWIGLRRLLNHVIKLFGHELAIDNKDLTGTRGLRTFGKPYEQGIREPFGFGSLHVVLLIMFAPTVFAKRNRSFFEGFSRILLVCSPFKLIFVNQNFADCFGLIISVQETDMENRIRLNSCLILVVSDSNSGVAYGLSTIHCFG